MQNQSTSSFIDAVEELRSDSEISTGNKNIPDDLKDSVCVLERWKIFVRDNESQFSPDLSLLTEGLERKSAMRLANSLPPNYYSF